MDDQEIQNRADELLPTINTKDVSIVSDNLVSVPENGGVVMMELENMIKSNVDGISKRKEELKKVNEMIQSALGNDAVYRDHEKAAKEAAKQKTATKAQIMSLPSNKQLLEKKKELTLEVKEMAQGLSEYLSEYTRMSGSTQLELFDGSVMEIVKVCKLIKRRK